MKRVSFALGVLIAFLAVWWLLGGRAIREIEAPRTDAVAKFDSSEAGLASSALPADIPEDLDGSGHDVVDPQANTDSCAELYRRAQSSNMRFGFADGREDEAGCAKALSIMFGPRVPAIPGLAGFEIRDFGDGSRRTILANESDNPEWSRPMEGAILSEIAALLDFPVTTLHAACRSSTCGLLFAYRVADHHGGNYNYFAQQLADELGFSGFHAGHSRGMDGNGFTIIYLGAWDTPRPEDGSYRSPPASFEELADANEANTPAQ